MYCTPDGATDPTFYAYCRRYYANNHGLIFLGHHVIRPKIEKILSEASLHCDHDRDPGQDCCQEFQPECTDISRLTKLRPRFITCWC